MAIQTNGKPAEPEPASREVLTSLAAEVDRQLVLSLGGELLDGSGFEDEIPETEFGAEGESNA